MFRVCRRSGAGLWVLALLASTAWGQAPGTGGDAPIPVLRPPLRIEITRNSTAGDAMAEQVVAINEKIAEVFQEEAVEFDPTEGLDRVQLVCEATGEVLRVGVDKRSPVYMERSFHRLRKNEPGRLAIRVTDPQSLRPGVYRGQLTAVLRSDNQTINRALQAIWPIEIAVHGRSIIKVEFEHARDNKLRVGVPASLRMRVATVGCDLGRGTVKLDWWAKGKEKERALYLHVPLEQVVDPLAFDAPGEQGCHPQWRDSALWTEVKTIEEASPPGGGALQQQYEIRVAAPDCFLPGTMQAQAAWEQVEAAANQTPLSVATSEIDVLPGVLAHPRLAFVNERVKIFVRTDRDFGDNLPLQVSQPDGKMAPVEMLKRRQQVVGEGAAVEYAGAFVPRLMGAYQLAWPETNQRAAVVENLGEPPGFQVCFGAEQNVARIEVFAGAPPFWVTESLGWKVTREAVCRFWYAPTLLRTAALEGVALYRGQPGEQLAPHHPEVEPLVQFKSGEEPLPQNPAVVRGTSPVASPEGQASLVWQLGASPETSPYLDVTIDLVRDEKPGHPRHVPGSHDFVQRLILHAQDTRGAPLARLAEIPLHVEVATAWQYYSVLGIVAGVGAGILALGAILWRYAVGPRPSRAKGKAALDPLAEFHDEGDIFSTRAPPPRPEASEYAPPENGAAGALEDKPAGAPASRSSNEPPPPSDSASQRDLWD